MPSPAGLVAGALSDVIWFVLESVLISMRVYTFPGGGFASVCDTPLLMVKSSPAESPTMSVAENSHLEREEVERVLASGIFERSPSLAQVLTYVCAKYFEGTADSIKEYNIAVDAFGRPPDFDQKKDSIVRVQVHRLRERLAEYYEAGGASNEVQIVIPQGRYVPTFVRRSAAQPGPPHPVEQISEQPGETSRAVGTLVPTNLSGAAPRPVAQAGGARKYWWTAGLAAAVLILLGVFAVWLSRP